MKSEIIKRALSGNHSIIAEIGVNHFDIATSYNLSIIEAAKLMVLRAKEAGANAVKFQSYKASTLAVKNSPSYWDTSEEKTTSQYSLFKKYDGFSFSEYKELSVYCISIGIEFLSTPFDNESVDYLEPLMHTYKISSSDLSNIPFIEYISKKNKPIILSTGASNLNEISEAVNTIKKYNDQPLVLMHCVLEYPTPFEHANLNKIVSLKQHFPTLIIGYSDHTRPDKYMETLKTAYNLGAIVIEKHFTLDKNISGNDHYHSMDFSDLEMISKGISFIQTIRGLYDIKVLDSESKARLNARRSLVSVKKILKNKVIEVTDLTYKRPGTGIPPSRINEFVGKTAKIDIEEDTILQENMFF